MESLNVCLPPVRQSSYGMIRLDNFKATVYLGIIITIYNENLPIFVSYTESEDQDQGSWTTKIYLNYIDQMILGFSICLTL